MASALPRRGTFSRLIRPSLLLGALALTGCSTVNNVVGTGKLDLACPKVAIVRDASTITQFRPGPGRDLTDVVSRAVLADFAGGCEYNRDGVTVNFALALVAERGPAFQGSQANYRYFVAITAPDDTVVAKQEFTTTVDFPANAPRAGTREDLQQQIPMPRDTDARNYQVLLGFQLSPQELEHNRAKDRR
jgi:hypothetical protein